MFHKQTGIAGEDNFLDFCSHYLLDVQTSCFLSFQSNALIAQDNTLQSVRSFYRNYFFFFYYES